MFDTDTSSPFHVLTVSTSKVRSYSANQNNAVFVKSRILYSVLFLYGQSLPLKPQTAIRNIFKNKKLSLENQTS